VSGAAPKSELPSDARNARRGCAFCSGLLLLAATPLLLVNGVLNHRASVELERAHDRLRESGAAMHLSDMVPPPARPEEDAAPIYNRAFAAMSAPIGSDVQSALQGEPEPEATPEAIDAYLATQKMVIDDLAAAVRLPRCDWRHEYGNGFAMMMPELMKMREVTRLLRLVAVRQAERGDPDGAVATAIVALGTSRALEEDPILISHLVRQACEQQTFKGLDRVLAEKPSERACRELIAAIDARHPAGQLARTLAGERAMALDLFETLREGKRPNIGGAEEDLLVRYQRVRRWCPWILDRDEATYIETMNESIAAAANAGKRSSLDAGAAIEARSRASSSSRLGSFNPVTGLMTPSYYRMFESEVTAEARRSSARAAVAIALFRARNGRVPDRLDELVPEVLPDVPRDPWIDTPLRYKREGNGFVVYSVGKNLFDDGGPLTPEQAAQGAPRPDDEGVRVRVR
jgi:hypothetical protein